MSDKTAEMLKEFMEDKFQSLQAQIDRRFDENTREHSGITSRQDKTNGHVTNLMKWKWIYWTTTSGILLALGWLLKIHLH